MKKFFWTVWWDGLLITVFMCGMMSFIMTFFGIVVLVAETKTNWWFVLCISYPWLMAAFGQFLMWVHDFCEFYKKYYS